MELTVDNATHRRLVLPTRGFRTSHDTLDDRAVAVVRLSCTVDGRPVVGWGEAAPLEAWGTESIQEVDATLSALRNPNSAFSIREIDAVYRAGDEAPATRFALETALLDAWTRRRSEPLASAFCAPEGVSESVAVNGTLGADADAAAIQRRVDEGFRCLKLKVASADVDTAAERVERIRNAIPEAVSLRVDANGRWTRDRARRFLDRVSDLSIEYVEQPVPADARADLVALAAESPIPIAADESAHPASRALDLLAEEIPVLVLKPAALGGLLRGVAIAERAAERGTRVVWTSAIESAIGRTAVLHLAASHGVGPHGLSTGDLLADDISRDVEEAAPGYRSLPPGPGLGISVDETALDRLARDSTTTR